MLNAYVVQAADKAALKAALLDATHIVYDITQQAGQIAEATWAIESMPPRALSFCLVWRSKQHLNAYSA